LARSRSARPPAAGRLKLPQVRRAATFFLVAFVVYNANLRYLASFDSLASSIIPFDIWKGKGFSLDDFSDLPRNVGYSVVPSKAGGWVSLYPVVTPLVVTPLYFPAAFREWFKAADGPIRAGMEKLAASLFVSVSVALLYILLSGLTTANVAAWLAVGYAFGTSTWVVSSQALWQHGFSGLFVICILLLLREVEEAGWCRLALLGFLAGLLTANRPSNVFVSAAVAWIVLRRTEMRRLAIFLIPAGLVAGLLFLYNTTHFHSILGGYGDFRASDGSAPGMSNWGIRGLACLLFSNRSLFLYSPFLLALSLFPWRKPTRFPGIRLLLFAYLLTLYVNARSASWAGGDCYGPRYALDALPILFVALVEPVERLSRGLGRWLFRAGIVVAVAFQLVGAFCYPGGGSSAETAVWDYRLASPVLAFKAGPEYPHFHPLFVRRVLSRDRLAPNESRAEYEWAGDPPAAVEAGSKVVLHVRVTNRSPVTWSSLGGWFNRGAVQLAAVWHPAESPGKSGIPGAPRWLAFRLDPDGSVTRDITVHAPDIEGRYQLVVGLRQQEMETFADRGVAPLEAAIQVVRGTGGRP